MKYNANILSALLNDFSIAESTMESAANSAGSAWEENEVYLDSIQGRISQLNASFQELSVTILDGNLIKGIVSLATGFVNVANSITKLTGVVPILATAFSTYFAISNFQKPVSDIMSLMSETGDSINDLIDNVIKSGKKLSSLPLFSIKPLQTYGIEKLDLTGFSVDSSELQNFISQLSGLDESQKSATLSLTNLTSSQQNYIRETLQSISAGEKLSGSMYAQALSTDLFNETQKNNLLTQLNLIDANGNYLTSNTDTVKSLLESANVTKTLSSEQKNAASSALTNTVALQAQTAATGAATVAQSALNKVLVIGKQLLLGFAIGAAVLVIQKIASAISDWYKSQDELNDIMNTSISNLESVKSNLDSLISQFDDVIKKINEIKSAGPLTFESQEELDSLNQQKENLEMQIELEKLKQENANRESEKDINQSYENYAKDNDIKLDTNQIDTSVSNMNTQSLMIAADTNNSINSTIAAYKSLKQARDDAFGDPETYQKYDSQLSDITDQLREQSEELIKYKQNYDEVGYDNLGKEAKENYDDISEVLEYILVLLGQISVINLPKFDGAKQELEGIYKNALGSSKENLVSYLQDFDELSPSVQEFVKTVIDAGGTYEEIANSTIASTENISDSLSQTTTNLEEQNQKLDEVQEAYQTVRGAIDEYNQKGTLTADTIQALSQLSPQYTQCLFDENGQLNINSGTLENVKTRYSDLASAIYENIKALQIKQGVEKIEELTSASKAASLWEQQQAMESVTEKYGDYSVLYEARQKKLLEMQKDSGFEQYILDADKYITQIIKGVETVGNALDKAKEDVYKDTDTQLNYNPPKQNNDNNKKQQEQKKSITDVISAWKSLYDVMDEYNSHGKISYETLDKLISMDSSLTECLIKQDGQLVINIARFRQLVSAQLAETVSSEDAKNNADELARMLQWLDENAATGMVTLDEFRDAVEGVGTALDDTQNKVDDFAGALQPLYELQFERKDKKFFTKEDIDNVLDGAQLLSEYDPNSGSNKFLTGNESDALFNLNYDAIVEEATKQIENEIARLDESKDSAAIAILNATKTAIQNGEQSGLDYLFGDSTTLDLVTEQMDAYQEKYETIKKAVEEYNKYHMITQDTMQELASVAPDYEEYLTFEGNQVKFNTEAFKENYKQMLLYLASVVKAAGGNEDLVNWLTSLATELNDFEFIMEGATDVVEEFKSALSDLKSIFTSLLDGIKNGFDEQNNKLQIWGEAIQNEIQDRIDALQDQKDAQDEMYDKEIQDLEDKKEALEDANDEEERAIKLAQLQDALAKAKANRTVRKYVEGQGYIWTTDDQEIKDAEKELSDQIRDWDQEDASNAIDDEIDKIKEEQEAAKDAIDDEIEKLEDLKDKYGEIIDLIGMSWDDYQAKLEAEAAAQNMTYDQMVLNLEDYKNDVISNMKDIQNIENTQEVIDKAEEIIGVIETIFDFVEKISSVAKILDSIFNGGEEGEGGLFSKIINGAKNLFDNLKTGFNGLVINVKEFASNIVGTFTNKVSGVWDKIKLGAENVLSGLTSGNGIFPSLKEKISLISNNIKNIFNSPSGLWESIKTGASTFISNISNIFNTNFPGIFQNIISLIGNSFNGLWNNLFNGASGIVQNIINLFSGLGSSVTGIIGNISNSLGTLGTAGLVGGAVIAGNTAINWVNDKVNQKFEDALEKGNTAEQVGWGIASGIVTSIRSPIEGIINGFKKIFGFSSGTKSVKKSNIYNVDEKGPELIVRKPASGRYTYLENGDGVVPADITKRLFELGANPSSFIERNMRDYKSQNIESRENKIVTVSIGDININNPIGDIDRLSNAIKQQLPNKIKQDINKR